MPQGRPVVLVDLAGGHEDKEALRFEVVGDRVTRVGVGEGQGGRPGEAGVQKTVLRRELYIYKEVKKMREKNVIACLPGGFPSRSGPAAAPPP